MDLTLIASAHMSASVYEAEIAPGTPTTGPPSVRSYAPQKWVHEKGSGFTGAIYTSPDRSHVVLAFAGTNPFSWGDIKADINIVANEVPIEQIGRASCRERV